MHPTKYHLELTPISDANETLKIKGRVVIEFRIDSTLTELTLSAWNITTTGCKLSRLEENNATVKRRRKRRTEIDNGSNKILITKKKRYFLRISHYTTVFVSH